MDEKSIQEAAEEQSKQTETVPAETEGQKPETEAPISEVLTPKKEEKKDEVRMVPEAVLLEYKNANKELKRDLKELKAMIESGASKKEVSADLKAIAEEHNIDADFLEKFAGAIKAQTESEIEEKYEKPRAEKERAKEFETLFTEHFDKALEAMPEYKNLANKDVIKSLVRDPKNANKTFSKILEEAYGHLVQGKKTLEPTVPGGGKDNAEVDFAKAQKDSEYYKQIMADPYLKRKYNDAMLKELGRVI